VTVTIQRPSSGLVKDFTLTRAIIKTDMVKDINGKKEFRSATTKSLRPHHGIRQQSRRRTRSRLEPTEGGGMKA